MKIVKAIDLDDQMIHRAKTENQKDNLEFFEMDMMKINHHFPGNTFQSVICFGNTLVHLTSENQILDLFKQVKEVLKEDGKFLFQIINYDRILDKEIDFLPTIENENIRFIRNYQFEPSSGFIHFETNLTVKKDELLKLKILYLFFLSAKIHLMNSWKQQDLLQYNFTEISKRKLGLKKVFRCLVLHNKAIAKKRASF